MSDAGTRILYNSSYRHGVDEKRRVQVPAKWRPKEPGTELTLVVWPRNAGNPCLRVMPPEKVASMLSDIEKMSNTDENKGVLKRLIGSKSVQVTLDSAGRICIPDEMMKAAGLPKDVMLVGVLDAFEIWDPAKYEQVSKADEVMAAQAFRFME